jgi:hypothetical protein
LIRTNRTLIEDNLEHTKKIRFAPAADLTVLDLRPEADQSRPILSAVNDGTADGRRRINR